MSDNKELVSHFDKPIEEITLGEVLEMSHFDRSKYIIEHPWSAKAGIDDYWRKNLIEMSEEALIDLSTQLSTGALS